MVTRRLFSPDQVDRAIETLARQIRKAFRHETTLLIVGIQSGGLNVAQRLRMALEEGGMGKIVLGSVDTTLYRDDIHRLFPGKGLLPMEIPIGVEEAAILLVDDVIFTGRSARAAMDALFCLGRPKVIRLAVLVDRGHRELPIQPDFTGLKVETRYEENVVVSWEGLEDCWVEVTQGERHTETS